MMSRAICYMCSSDQVMVLGDHPDFPALVFRCKECGLCQSTYVPDSLLRAYYAKAYRETRHEKVSESYVERMEQRAEAQFDFIRRHVPDLRRDGTGLEFGAGAGLLSGRCQKEGMRMFAIELDREFAAHITASGAASVITEDDLAGDPSPVGKCDIVLASHVFEHLNDPYQWLANVFKHLADGAIVFLEVPREDPEILMDALARGKRGVGHLFYFSEATFRLLISRVEGFDLEAAEVCGPGTYQYIDEASVDAAQNSKAEGVWIRAILRKTGEHCKFRASDARYFRASSEQIGRQFARKNRAAARERERLLGKMRAAEASLKQAEKAAAVERDFFQRQEKSFRVSLEALRQEQPPVFAVSPPESRSDLSSRIRARLTTDISVVAYEVPTTRRIHFGGPKPVLNYIDFLDRGRSAVSARLVHGERLTNSGARALLLGGSRVTIINGLHSFLFDSTFAISPQLYNVWVYLHETEWVFDTHKKDDPARFARTLEYLRQCRILCVSKKQAEFLKERYDIAQSKVIYNNTPVPSLKKAVNQPSDGRIRIGMVGSNQARKGVSIFSRLADHAADSGRDWEFVWIGHNGKLLSDLYYSDKVQWVGRKWGRDLAEEMGQLDVFFLASEDDPFPLVCLEALALGKRVVAYEKTGTVEVISSLKGCAVYSDYDVESAYSALNKALQDTPNVDELQRVGQEYSSVERFAERLHAAVLVSVDQTPLEKMVGNRTNRLRKAVRRVIPAFSR